MNPKKPKYPTWNYILEILSSQKLSSSAVDKRWAEEYPKYSILVFWDPHLY